MASAGEVGRPAPTSRISMSPTPPVLGTPTANLMDDFALNQPIRLATVLLAEDSEDDRALAFRALRRCGAAVTVQVATDGQRALWLVEDAGTDVPDLVLLDVKMPRVSGIEVLGALRKDPRYDIVPIVMMTSSDEPHDVASCRSLGADAYVRKPVDFEEYLDVVTQIAKFWLCKGRGAKGAPYSLLESEPLGA